MISAEAVRVVNLAMDLWTQRRGALMRSGADWRVGDTKLLYESLTEALESSEPKATPS